MSETSQTAAARKRRISCEFFPPRSDSGVDGLTRVVAKLAAFGPDFYSCTYGAGGSTRDGTRDTIRHLLSLNLDAAPHLSIGADEKDSIFALLDDYRDMGVRRIVALRGDVPSGVGRTRNTHNAESLVRWIREHSGDHFHLEVAAYPEVHPDAHSPEDDLEFFARKVDAGADSAITQYFYNPHAFYDFADRAAARGLTLPMISNTWLCCVASTWFSYVLWSCQGQMSGVKWANVIADKCLAAGGNYQVQFVFLVVMPAHQGIGVAVLKVAYSPIHRANQLLLQAFIVVIAWQFPVNNFLLVIGRLIQALHVSNSKNKYKKSCKHEHSRIIC